MIIYPTLMTITKKRAYQFFTPFDIKDFVTTNHDPSLRGIYFLDAFKIFNYF